MDHNWALKWRRKTREILVIIVHFRNDNRKMNFKILSSGEEEIRRFRDAEIGLQAGQNKGASQSGHGGMGNTRHM